MDRASEDGWREKVERLERKNYLGFSYYLKVNYSRAGQARTRLFCSGQPDGASAYRLPPRQAPGLRHHLHSRVQQPTEQTLLQLCEQRPRDALLSLP
ncbi:uncharacterized protein isoform X4 [Castor canadensis]|uniref:Uncharacterized protein isoform X4 n=1 Tax=Castor canadensis TaxID=51338 RepID=A0AC58L7Z5_CASCN